jgi:hypothetical protein
MREVIGRAWLCLSGILSQKNSAGLEPAFFTSATASYGLAATRSSCLEGARVGEREQGDA